MPALLESPEGVLPWVLLLLLSALPLEQAGAAKIIEQPQLTVESVTATLAGWDRQTLLEMAEKARAAAIPDATERVAAVICEVAK